MAKIEEEWTREYRFRIKQVENDLGYEICGAPDNKKAPCPKIPFSITGRCLRHSPPGELQKIVAPNDVSDKKKIGWNEFKEKWAEVPSNTRWMILATILILLSGSYLVCKRPEKRPDKPVTVTRRPAQKGSMATEKNETEQKVLTQIAMIYRGLMSKLSPRDNDRLIRAYRNMDTNYLKNSPNAQIQKYNRALKEILETGKLKISILNGTMHRGMARTTAQYLKKYHYPIANVGNTKKKEYPSTIMNYHPGYEHQAKRIGVLLNITHLVPRPDIRKYNIIITIGKDIAR